MTHTLNLTDCTADLATQVGGKAVGLGHLLQEARSLDPRRLDDSPGWSVPPGFVVTTSAYREWLSTQMLEGEIQRLLEGDHEDPSASIHALFAGAELPAELAAEINRAYAELDYGAGDVLVAVRSSAIAEDQADASFAGQQETYLGIRGRDSVADHVIRCWSSLFTPHAISYRRHLGVPPSQVAMAVVVQRMVEAEAAGVMITIDPVTGDRSQIAIEAVVGLGEPLVQGELNPDRWAVDKVTMEIRSRSAAAKPFAERLDVTTGGTCRVELEPGVAEALCLSDGEVARVAELGKRIERARCRAMDVEWAIGPGPSGPRHLYLLQARPETVWSSRPVVPVAGSATTALDRMLASMLRGSMRDKKGA